MKTLVWLRQDLRLSDNPALVFACKQGAVIPLFILDDGAEGEWQMGGAQRWWLHQSLAALDSDLRERGSALVLRRGESADVLTTIIAEHGIDSVVWNRRYEPDIVERDTRIKESLKSRGVYVQSFNATLLNEPWEVQNLSGKPFQVFTPYWRHCLKRPDPSEPISAPKSIEKPTQWPRTESLAALDLMPRIAWYRRMEQSWQPGEAGAAKNRKAFVQGHVWGYTETRNLPAIRGTSRLSPHLHFGEVSPRQVWHAVKTRGARVGLLTNEWRTNQFLTELYWREFAYHLLYHFRHTPTQPLRTEFAQFPWATNSRHLKAWQGGSTGVPLVDAGMRELWATGWMHNRVRMIAGSFLVKNLLIAWQDGARWFWDTLLDADLASNTLGWQWCAGCGADAAPYFRIFNPVSQGEKFDPDGAYVREWVPELAKLQTKFIHAPWDAPPSVLRAASVQLGKNYPEPIVDLKATRTRALDAYRKMRGTS
ncbi:MAG: deoxyribodipyrimidine photo-lyase [Gammaproteobacteria bacterium]|nr:deoxyribodipyrimidine photo-lyase [Gammaproteobacteria bacterium]